MLTQSTSQPDDRLAAHLRGFGPLGIIAMLAILLSGNVILVNMVVLPVGAVLILLWVRLSETPWHAIGYVRPKNWIVTLAAGLAFGIAFKLLLKAIVMPLLGAPPINQAYHFLAGNTAILPAAVLAMLVAGFGEETVFRGYMFERLGKILGSSNRVKAATVLITSAWFAIGHYSNQGIPGVQQAAITGLTFGTVFAVTGRLWLLIIAHAAFDLTALAIIYCDLEGNVSQWVFGPVEP